MAVSEASSLTLEWGILSKSAKAVRGKRKTEAEDQPDTRGVPNNLCGTNRHFRSFFDIPTTSSGEPFRNV
jgi:hypothetical protein